VKKSYIDDQGQTWYEGDNVIKCLWYEGLWPKSWTYYLPRKIHHQP
jgi:hypothetical protein